MHSPASEFYCQLRKNNLYLTMLRLFVCALKPIIKLVFETFQNRVMEAGMEMKIGNRIAELRRQKGMTQEHLAEVLGVSAPAVSKWETGHSCPDIAMLCPLARALGTNVDTLLAYEEFLSAEQVTERITEIVEIRREQGTAQAEAALRALMKQYPNSIPLKFQAVAIFTSFEIMNMECTQEDKERWRRDKTKLLTEVYESRDPEYIQHAISALASLAMQEDDLERAEALLGELPETPDDATGLWVNLYKKKGQTEKAEELLQKRMFVLSTQMMAFLTTMIECAQTEKALKLCGIYRKLEEIIYVGGGSGALLFAECYGRAGREREAADSLIAYLESHAGTWPQTNPLLFEPTMKRNDSKKKPSEEMRAMMLRCILSDDTLSEICKREDVKRAIQNFAGEDSILL